jgi:hypothetical protein
LGGLDLGFSDTLSGEFESRLSHMIALIKKK